MKNRAFVCLAVAVCALISTPTAAQETDLTKLSLADLLNVEVTSVSRKEQRLSRTAAAVHVISQEDIRRSGARTLPDLLRTVPGFTVARIDANSWAIGARGFAGLYASKLLVLIDGRSVYTPLFAGVHWEMQNLLPDDIERIEVIRGPGGTLWGANAINGVINIITKSAVATRGGLVRGVIAGPRGGEAAFRYGTAATERVDFRVFGRAIRRDSEQFGGIANLDRGAIEVGGGRVDWRRSDIETLSIRSTVQRGRIDRGLAGPTGLVSSPGSFDQGHVVASWTHAPSGRSDTAVQFYFDTYSGHGQGFDHSSRIADVDARHRRALGRRHEVVAGAGFRGWENHATGFAPERERTRLIHAFVQDEIELASGLHVTPGSKFEHNDYTGFEVQPSVRAVWQPAAKHVIWAAASRAVRTPSRVNRGARVLFTAPHPSGALVPVELSGNPNMESERLRGLEVGYRAQLGSASFDVAGFQNDYAALETAEAILGPTGVPEYYPVMRLMMGNGLEGKTAGIELAGTWSPVRWVKFSGSYTRLALDLVNSPSSLDVLAKNVQNASAPRQQAHGTAYLDLPGRTEASVLLSRVGAIEGINVRPYTRLDLNLGWRATQHVDLAVGVQNLLRDPLGEFVDVSGVQALPARPQAFGELKWRF
jgi:iron complex outermembrane receptor protein